MGRRKKGESDITIRNRLIERMGEFFFSRGTVSVSMDDVARSFQMSKKTLYKFFPNKEDMILKVARRFIGRIGTFVEGKLAEIDEGGAEAFIPAVMEILGRLGSIILSMSARFVLDMENNSPIIMQKLYAIRQDLIVSMFGRVLRKGQTLGKIRQDIDPELASRVYAGMINMITSKLGPSYAPFDVYMTVVKIIFQGVLRPEAHADFHPEALLLKTSGTPWDFLRSRPPQGTKRGAGVDAEKSPDADEPGRE